MTKTHVIAVASSPDRAERFEFDIDFATGHITGLSATGINPDYCRATLESLRDQPEAMACFAWQQDYATPNPLLIPKSLAWQLMARGWRLIGDLASIEPPMPDPLPEGTLA